jgi:hypothetical protein
MLQRFQHRALVPCPGPALKAPLFFDPYDRPHLTSFMRIALGVGQARALQPFERLFHVLGQRGARTQPTVGRGIGDATRKHRSLARAVGRGAVGHVADDVSAVVARFGAPRGRAGKPASPA